MNIPISSIDKLFIQIDSFGDNPFVLGSIAIVNSSPSIELLKARVRILQETYPRLSCGLNKNKINFQHLSPAFPDQCVEVLECFLESLEDNHLLEWIQGLSLNLNICESKPAWGIAVGKISQTKKTAIALFMHHAISDGIGMFSMLQELLSGLEKRPDMKLIASIKKDEGTKIGFKNMCFEWISIIFGLILTPKSLSTSGRKQSKMSYSCLTVDFIRLRKLKEHYGVGIVDICNFLIGKSLMDCGFVNSGSPVKFMMPYKLNKDASLSTLGNDLGILFAEIIPKNEQNVKLALKTLEKRRIALKNCGFFQCLKVFSKLFNVLPKTISRFLWQYINKKSVLMFTNIPTPLELNDIAGTKIEKIIGVPPIIPGQKMSICLISKDNKAIFSFFLTKDCPTSAETFKESFLLNLEKMHSIFKRI